MRACVRVWMLGVALAVALGGLGLVLGWVGSLQARAREAEEQALKAQGLLAAQAASAARLRREAESLRAQLARVRRAAPSARVREVVRYKTREVVVPSTGHGVPPSTAPGSRGSGADVADQQSAPGGATCPPLRLRFELLDARLETRAGTRVAVGELAVYRVSPPPEELVDLVPLQATTHLVDDARPSGRWLFGPAVGVLDGQWALGGAAVGPEARVLGLRGRPVVMALAGSGDWMVAGALALRW